MPVKQWLLGIRQRLFKSLRGAQRPGNLVPSASFLGPIDTVGTKLPRCTRNDGGGVEKAQSIRVLCPEHQQRSFGNYPQRAHSLQAEYSARLLYPPMPKIPLRTITRSAAISILSILCIHVKKSMPKTTDTPLLTPAPLRPLTWIPQGQTNPVRSPACARPRPQPKATVDCPPPQLKSGIFG